jgi:hypothetical protein
MWVTDEAGNQDFCTVILNLQDGSGDGCLDDIGSRASVAGKVVNESNTPIKNLSVHIMDAEISILNAQTDELGTYAIRNVPVGRAYELEPKLNENILNGVSTLDLVHIQRHILATTNLPSAYKVISADVNDDQKITASDLVALRKVILGINTTFPNNQKSYRFVQKDVVFSNPMKPFPVPFRYKYNPLTDDMENQDFIMIKIGDVNGSASYNVHDTYTEPRSTMNLQYEIKEEFGKKFIYFYSSENASISGMQMTLSGVNLKHAIKGQIEFDHENFAITRDGNINISWNTATLENIDPNSPIFGFEVASASEYVKIHEGLNDEVYGEKDEVKSISLTKRSNVSESSPFVVYQNEPNPFTDQTIIKFDLPKSGIANLTISTIDGKVIHTESSTFEAGQNQFIVNQKQLGVNGILYYSVESSGLKSSLKMISVK